MTPLALTASEGASASRPRRVGLPLAAKLAFGLIGLVALVLIVNGAIDAFLSYRQAKSAALEVQSEKARAAAAQVGGFLDEIQTELGWTAGVEWGYAKLEQQRYDFIRLLRQAPAVTAVAYIDGNGREQLAVSRLEPEAVASGKDYSADPRFVRAVADKAWFGPVEFRRGSEPYMTVAVAHVGRTPGVTVADVNLKLVWDVVSAIHVGEKGFAYVVDEHGRLIAHPDLSLVLRDTDFSHLPQVAAALAGTGAGTAETAVSFDGSKVLTAYAVAPKTHWAVFVEQPLSEALATAYRSLLRSLALLGFGLALAAVSGVALARRMAAPIRALQAGAEQLGAGDLNQRLDIRTGDEIETLAGAFNRMAARLQESYENLESKVEARTRDLNDALAQQRASAEILSAVSQSIDDATPVFERIVEASRQLFASDNVAIFRVDDERMVRMAAWRGPLTERGSKDVTPLEQSYTGRVARTREILHIPDNAKEPDLSEAMRERIRLAGSVSLFYAPILAGEDILGSLGAIRSPARPFSEKELALAQTLADQAAIAIRNAQLFKQVRERTRDLEESLAQQTATADVLKVISRSAFDLDAILKTLVTSAMNLCRADGGQIFKRHDDGNYRYAASDMNVAAEYIEHERNTVIAPGRGTLIGRVALSKATVRIVDAWADEEYAEKAEAQIGGVRSMLGVPLLRDGEPIGAFALARQEPVAFTQQQVDLVTTFADQAVIAIENARLFEEVRARTRDLEESLAQQTATADVLRVISRSAFDVQPVFETIAMRANQLIGARSTTVYRLVGEDLHIVALTTIDPEADAEFRALFPRRASEVTTFGAVRGGDILQIPDMWDSRMASPAAREAARKRGLRAYLLVPMMYNGDAIGMFSVARPTTGAFAPQHVDMLRTFADQAVIAIENARLFEEVRAKTLDLEQSLAYQVATSDVLSAIGTSMADPQLVFERITEAVQRLMPQTHAGIFLLPGDGRAHLAAHRFSAVVEGHYPAPISHDYGSSLAVHQQLYLPSILNSSEAMPHQRRIAETIGDFSITDTAMVWEGRALGFVSTARRPPRPFSERELQVLRTFADQAVIAIENARLFDEVQARTRDLEESLAQQTATADVLKVISRSAFDLRPVLDTLIASATALCEARDCTIFLRDGDVLRYRATLASSPELTEYFATHPTTANRHSVVGRVMLSGSFELIPDVLEDKDYVVPAYTFGRARALLGVPLLRDGKVEGALVLARSEPGPFTQRQIELVQTFADQAVIAIENARLFEEVQAKTRDLEESLAQQTATADVLKVISRSAFDLDAIFQTLVATAVDLCKASSGTVCVRDGDVFRYRGMAGPEASPELQRFLSEHPLDEPTRGTAAGRAILSRRTEEIADVLLESDYAVPFAAHGSPARSLLGVPLLGKTETLGAIVVARAEPGAFPQRHVEILRTFADQAVIAIENARLFDEVQARTRELQASLDDLRKAQDRLVQSEKLASLGQLTAGIAHEIKNPLNFVNNFASLSRELLEELRDTLAKLPEDAKAEAEDLVGMIDSNLDKVASHGKRADSIVKNMLLHSREGSGERSSVNINAMVEEALNLGYHGARADKPGFNVTLEKDFDPQAGTADIYLQEVTRVLLNLISNGFYAAAKRKLSAGADYAPTLKATTRDLGHKVEIRIRDNGTGIPDEVRAKMFNPFFTTKPAGEGTGLGLSLSHDIVVKQHGGTLDVETEPGAFTEFILTLPRGEARA